MCFPSLVMCWSFFYIDNLFGAVCYHQNDRELSYFKCLAWVSYNDWVTHCISINRVKFIISRTAHICLLVHTKPIAKIIIIKKSHTKTIQQMTLNQLRTLSVYLKCCNKSATISLWFHSFVICCCLIRFFFLSLFVFSLFIYFFFKPSF